MRQKGIVLVTGGAGFIGSNLIRALNDHGFTEILVVDELEANSEKLSNCKGCAVLDFVEKDTFSDMLQRGRLEHEVAMVYHQGACTDTLVDDEALMMESNFAFSKRLLDWAAERRITMVYASSAAIYGGSSAFTEDPRNEAPLNAYGRSKLAFDRYVRERLNCIDTTLVGLRYFNVYGPREGHKGRMMSMVGRMYRQLIDSSTITLFEGTGGFGDGEQRRDFVFVDDVVKINLEFGCGPPRKGIFNVGTGSSRSFRDIARIWIESLGSGRVHYVPVPAAIRERYQSFTEADLTELRRAGYDGGFTPLERGVAMYCEWLESERLKEIGIG
jgi:ADP-L-glycero-D-manno-heptose 6-epimerase